MRDLTDADLLAATRCRLAGTRSRGATGRELEAPERERFAELAFRERFEDADELRLRPDFFGAAALLFVNADATFLVTFSVLAATAPSVEPIFRATSVSISLPDSVPCESVMVALLWGKTPQGAFAECSETIHRRM